MKDLGENVPGYKIRDMIKEVDIDENGVITFDEFLEVGVYLQIFFLVIYIFGVVV